MTVTGLNEEGACYGFVLSHKQIPSITKKFIVLAFGDTEFKSPSPKWYSHFTKEPCSSSEGETV